MRIVSIDDSFTEGMVDKRPDGTLLGWADRVAMGLADAVAYEPTRLAGRGSAGS